ncbi:hypothetical protein pb186bvf_006980 [Paramecium bursaria]
MGGACAATYVSFSLGSQLPVACRKMGQRIGLGYLLFKDILKLNLPKDIGQSNEVIKAFRQSEQQANALQREFRSSVSKLKQEIQQQIPEELNKNPYKILELKNDRKPIVQQNTLHGVDLIVYYMNERQRLKELQKSKQNREGFYKNL